MFELCFTPALSLVQVARQKTKIVPFCNKQDDEIVLEVVLLLLS